MDFNKVTAIVRTECLEEVERALQALGVPGITVTRVKGYGEHANFLRSDWCCTHARLEVYAERAYIDGLVEAILDKAHTGLPGDGIVTVIPVERLVRIREKRGS